MLKPAKKAPPRTEYEEQVAFVDWLELMQSEGHDIVFTANKNDVWSTPWRAGRYRRMGLRRGLPDLLVIVNRHLIFVEMKRAKKSLSRVSQDQRVWIDKINATGAIARVCLGAQEAIQLIISYL